mmetsp:Transcript_3058/g.8309  ORF Transcript_3058/g.8309 Transcript_3058/m.8309 type:complete len:312 (-) Transcript_3058:114-1049(-)
MDGLLLGEDVDVDVDVFTQQQTIHIRTSQKPGLRGCARLWRLQHALLCVSIHRRHRRERQNGCAWSGCKGGWQRRVREAVRTTRDGVGRKSGDEATSCHGGTRLRATRQPNARLRRRPPAFVVDVGKAAHLRIRGSRRAVLGALRGCICRWIPRRRHICVKKWFCCLFVCFFTRFFFCHFSYSISMAIPSSSSSPPSLVLFVSAVFLVDADDPLPAVGGTTPAAFDVRSTHPASGSSLTSSLSSPAKSPPMNATGSRAAFFMMGSSSAFAMASSGFSCVPPVLSSPPPGVLGDCAGTATTLAQLRMLRMRS